MVRIVITVITRSAENGKTHKKSAVASAYKDVKDTADAVSFCIKEHIERSECDECFRKDEKAASGP